MAELHFCTSNHNKAREFEDILKGWYPRLKEQIHISVADIDIPELQGLPQQISEEKCRWAYKQLNKPVVVEDTALEYNCYKGLPGPYVKWFLTALGPAGLHDMLKGQEDKTAVAVTRLALWDVESQKPVVFEGRTTGRIVAPRGRLHFGWDSIFEPDGYTETYGEMSAEEKNKISHRGKAVRQLGLYLETHKVSQSRAEKSVNPVMSTTS